MVYLLQELKTKKGKYNYNIVNYMTDQERNVNPPILNVCPHCIQIKWFYIFFEEDSWSNENDIFVSDIKKMKDLSLQVGRE